MFYHEGGYDDTAIRDGGFPALRPRSILTGECLKIAGVERKESWFIDCEGMKRSPRVPGWQEEDLTSNIQNEGKNGDLHKV